MSNEPTITFYAISSEAAAAELGLVSWNPADKFMVVEYWAEAEQYEISGGFATRAALEDAMAGEAYQWY